MTLRALLLLLLLLLENDIGSATIVVFVVAGNDILSATVVVDIVVVVLVAGNDIVRGVLSIDSLPLDLHWSLNIYYLSKLLITFHLNPVSPYSPFPSHYFFLSISTSQCCLL